MMTISTADLLQLLAAQTSYTKRHQVCTLDVVRDNEFAFEVDIRIQMPRDQAQFVQLRHAQTEYTGKGLQYDSVTSVNNNP